MVIATTTLALYVGQKEMLSFRFPMETKISVSDIADGQPTLPQFVHQTAEQYGVTKAGKLITKLPISVAFTKTIPFLFISRIYTRRILLVVFI